MNDQSLVEVGGSGIDGLACDVSGLETLLAASRLEPKRRGQSPRSYLKALDGQ
jgi:hypothetical protein